MCLTPHLGTRFFCSKMESNSEQDSRVADLCFPYPRPEDYDSDVWNTLAAKYVEFRECLLPLPQKTRDAVSLLDGEALRNRIRELSFYTDYMTPEQAGTFVREEIQR